MDIRGTLRWLSLRMSSHDPWSLPNAVDQKSHQASEKVREYQRNPGQECSFWIHYTYYECGILEVERSSVFQPF